jgi:glycosyltransferase involved in cell wall biosynthesis
MIRPAIVHEVRTDHRGQEEVVDQLCRLWPRAEVVTALIDERTPEGLRAARVREAALRLLHRSDGRQLPLFGTSPAAVSPVDLSGFDVVVTVHRLFAQWVPAPSGIPMVSYVHGPARSMWDPRMRTYEDTGRVARRAWDARAARYRTTDRAAAMRPDVLVAASRAVAGRIRAVWDRHAEVVPPPVDVDWYRPAPQRTEEDFFLYAGRLLPRKRADVAVAAARAAGVQLVVAGDGPSRPALEQMAGRRVQFVGQVGATELRELYRRCAAVVVPGEEDFGRVSVEAQACGTPVLALGAGGSLDTVVDGVTGRLWRPVYDDTAIGSLAYEMRRFDPGSYDPAQLRRHAEGFAPGRFCRDLQVIVGRVLAEVERAGTRTSYRGTAERQSVPC